MVNRIRGRAICLLRDRGSICPFFPIGPDDVRKRLFHTHKGFFYLKRGQFPEELQSDWDWVMNQLTKFELIVRDDGSIFRGSVENTCNRIKKKTGVKIAKRILGIFLYLESH